MIACPHTPPHAALCCRAADTPVIAWEQDGALLSAVIFNNVTDAKPLAGARAACHAVQKRLPSKLRKGAAVETTTFGYVFDPRKPAKKGEALQLPRLCGPS